MTARTVALPVTSAALFAVAGVIDLSFLAVIGSTDAAPLPVIILLALLGAVTLAVLRPARRGNRAALITAVILRVISALLAFVSFFAGAPAWIKACEAVVIVATIAALILLRRQASRTVPA